jgi:BirA family biotin operon repressor/biotin-[acetyl-CoA-carboxylase] ligase
MPNLPVSLKQITGTYFDPIELAKELCMNLDRRLHLLNTGQFEHQLLEYNATLYKKNEVVQFKKANRKFEATINGVNEQGQLILTHGIQETIDFGDLEWIL